VANTHLTDADATSLASNHTLSSLNIYGSLCLTRVGLAFFLNNSTLTSLERTTPDQKSAKLEKSIDKQLIANQHHRKQAALASWLQLFMWLAIDRNHEDFQSLFSRLPFEIILKIIGHLDFSILEKTAAEISAAEKAAAKKGVVITTTSVNLLAICLYEKPAAERAKLMALFIFKHLSEINKVLHQHSGPLRFTQHIATGNINVFLKGTNQKVLPPPAITPLFKRLVDNSNKKEEAAESPNKKRKLR
jgi:hypothetical protein